MHTSFLSGLFAVKVHYGTLCVKATLKVSAQKCTLAKWRIGNVYSNSVWLIELFILVEYTVQYLTVECLLRYNYEYAKGKGVRLQSDESNRSALSIRGVLRLSPRVLDLLAPRGSTWGQPLTQVRTA